MSKRISAVLLCVAMMFSMIPMTAIAADDNTKDSEKKNFSEKAAVIAVSAKSPDREGAEYAFDGDTKDTKWCVTQDSGWVVFELQESAQPNQMLVHHAGGGNNRYDQTKAGITKKYALQVLRNEQAYYDQPTPDYLSKDANWKTVAEENENTERAAKETRINLTESRRIYRFKVDDAGDDNIIRIYEIQLFGKDAQSTERKKIELGTRGVADKDFLYFGKYNSTDIKWKVLDADRDNSGKENSMFLLSEYLVEQSNQQFDINGQPNEFQTHANDWQHSDAQAWCIAFTDKAFTAPEKAAFKSISKTDEPIRRYNSEWGTSALSDETVFYLSAEEAAKYISPNNWGEGLAATTSGNGKGSWWLRSGGSFAYNVAGYVDRYGEVTSIMVDSHSIGARPAFNLNLQSVLFSSAAKGGKSSGTVGADALQPVPEYASDTAREWKVTLIDPGHQGFDAQAGNGAATSVTADYSNWSVDVSYTGAKTGEKVYISAMLCDAGGNVLYYGHLAQNSASGTQSVNIPAGLGVGKYTLKVFSEELNGENKTDYASALKDIALEVVPLPVLSSDKTGAEISADVPNTWFPGSTLQVVVNQINDRQTEYTLSLEAGGITYQPNGTTLVSLPAPEAMTAAEVNVYRRHDNGTYTDMHATLTDGKLSFPSKGLGTFVLTTDFLDAKPGDVTGDGTVNLADYSAMTDHISGMDTDTLSRRTKYTADLNHDTAIDAFDAALLDRILKD